MVSFWNQDVLNIYSSFHVVVSAVVVVVGLIFCDFPPF